MNAQESVFPQAQTVHDKFHIAAYLGEAVDKTRRSEHCTLTRQDDTTLNKSKYLWLRSEANLTDKQKAALDALISLDLETAKVHKCVNEVRAFKESFRAFFDSSSQEEATTFFVNWLQGMLALGNLHLTRIARMFQKPLAGLLAYIEYRVTNVAAEALNGGPICQDSG